MARNEQVCKLFLPRRAAKPPTGTVYRFNSDTDVAQLDIPTLIAQHPCIIEWPERLGQHILRPCIHCAIDSWGAHRPLLSTHDTQARPIVDWGRWVFFKKC